MILLLLGLNLALARPLPLLGPSGPMWIGPLPPGVEDPRGLALIDPADGSLYLELPGAAGAFVWEAGGWRRGEQALKGEDPTALIDDNPVPAHLRMSIEGGEWVRQDEINRRADQTGREIVASGPRWAWQEGALVELVDRQGGRVRLRGDAMGRPVRVDWPDGSVLVIEWDAFNRVALLDGPDRGQSLRVLWQDGDLRVNGPDGAPTVVQIRPGENAGEEQVRVSDGSGRQSVAWYRSDGGRRLIGWEDPRGLRSRVRWKEDRVEVDDAGSRPWWVEQDPEGRVKRASDPSGGIWTWRRDPAGQVVGVEDPGGRVHTWTRDAEGRLTGVGRGAMPWALRRDGAGRIEELIDPVGAVVRLQRDALGRVRRILDPGGNEVRLDRSASGAIEAVQTRTGARLRLDRDLLGRLTRLGGPGDNRLDLRRDGAGRLVGLSDDRGQSVELDRGGRGELSRLRASDGQSVALVRDGLSRLAALRWADGSELRLRRDSMGEVVQVDLGEESLVLQRDLNLALTRLGEVRFVRDAGGRVRQLQVSGRTVELTRDAAGLIRGVRAGRIELSLGRDAAGRVVSWSGSDGEVRVKRNLAGRITSEEVSLPTEGPAAGAPEGAVGKREALSLSWELGGRIQKVEEGARSWRFMRDAAGRLLRVQGPTGLSLGLDRDAQGRLVLIRNPFQSVVRLAWEGAGLRATVHDATDRVVATRRAELDSHGRVRQDEDALWGQRSWRRDGAGRVIAVESGGRPAWSLGASGARGPDGWAVERDAAGRPVTARASPGALPWGMASSELSYRWSEAGPLVALGDGLSAARIEHDELGRLVGVQVDPGSSWRLRYDARGRLASIEQDGLEVERLRWGPAVDGGAQALLTSGPRASTVWVPGGSGLGGAVSGTTGRRWDETRDPRGLPWWQILADGELALRSLDLRGYPEHPIEEGMALMGPGASIQLFAGGPTLVPTEADWGEVPAGVALDPVSGDRLDGLRPWPWEDAGLGSRGSASAVDPEAWQSGEGIWANPLRLLVAMGQLEEPEGGAWLELPAEGSSVGFLPASLDRMRPPLGPSLEALPLDEDRLTQAWILACLPGGMEPSTEALGRVLLAQELDLPWLPPGLSLPLPGWRARGLAISGVQD